MKLYQFNKKGPFGRFSSKGYFVPDNMLLKSDWFLDKNGWLNRNRGSFKTFSILYKTVKNPWLEY